jgi:Zn-dependent protease with chaperone function
MTIHDLAKLSKNEMEALFKKSLGRSRVFTLFTILWAAFCIWLYFTTTNDTLKNSIFIFFCIALGLWFVIILGQTLLFRFISVKLSRVKETQIGKYSTEEIRQLIEKAISKSLAKEKPEVYILGLNYVNAFAINISLFNFIKFLNAVYISKKCFSSLTKDEIEALVLHEMGHFNKYQYSEMKLLNLGLYLYLIMPFAFTVLFQGILLKIGFVFICFLIILIFLSTIRRMKDYDMHVLEYLSDLFAAERTSNLAVINMIITVGRESVEVKELNKKKILKRIFLPVKRTIIDWSAFDNHMINGKIEAEEYQKLINTLNSIENPQMISDSIVDHNSRTHPSLTNRVLFINKNIKNI